MRVLIIEDNDDVAANIGDYLEARGHQPDFAYDGLGGLHLAVTGLGIPGQDLDRVTDRHFIGENGGYGLGLSIVRTLCKRYGWGLELDREATGTTVRVSFDR